MLLSTDFCNQKKVSERTVSLRIEQGPFPSILEAYITCYSGCCLQTINQSLRTLFSDDITQSGFAFCLRISLRELIKQLRQTILGTALLPTSGDIWVQLISVAESYSTNEVRS
ncbi:hypothetical protein ABKN59_007410 [Abortiporus biennis]